MPPELGDALVERPKVYAELQARPDFRGSLDPHSHVLQRVLTDYHFPAKVPCGLSSCHTPHLTGFLVRTTGGLETAIGHVCGRKIFGEEVWDLAAAKYERQRKRLDLLNRAQFIQSSAATIRQAIEGAMGDRFGVRWVRDVRRAFQSILGEGLCDSLGADQKRGQLEVTQVRERSAAEMDRLADLWKRPREHFRNETYPVGRLQSAAWISFEFSKALRDELQTPLDEFSKLNPTDLPTPTLRQRLKPFDGWEKKVADASAAARTAVEFLDENNLRLLVLWIPDQMSGRRQALQQWIGSAAHLMLLHGKND